MLKRDYGQILAGVQPANTVTSLGGSLTITALSFACSSLEDIGEVVDTLAVRSLDELGPLRDQFDTKKMVWMPMNFGSFVTPERRFRVRVMTSIPARTVLLVSKNGLGAQVIVSDET
jgi:hypothetical protein